MTGLKRRGRGGFGIFTKTIEQYVAELKKMPEISKIRFIGEFRGEADGVGYGSLTKIVYNEEFGIIDEPRAYINGESRSMSLRKGRVTNVELAFLRACGVYYLLMQHMARVSITKSDFDAISFVANENVKSGQSYRVGVISLKVSNSIGV